MMKWSTTTQQTNSISSIQSKALMQASQTTKTMPCSCQTQKSNPITRLTFEQTIELHRYIINWIQGLPTETRTNARSRRLRV
ncbi:hypothetical protein FGO68_gene17758 [Halteria grandinella]|uniref:Uncharacterized protein n=1 Tax=Halteria grandinella TaxID=5974 RepID=A0A8J8NT99_HALGN|nr:hypothetical protein FGO68_gene17758 [Halteria grandinella]